MLEWINISEAVPSLGSLIKSNYEIVIIVCLMALTNLSTKATTRATIIRCGLVKAIIKSLRIQSSVIKFNAAKALVNLA